MQGKFPKTRPLVVDFFCGAGGMSLGFEQAGFDIALGIDIDGHHVATHERNFPYGKSLCASIIDLDGKRIRREIGSDREIDVVIGGPPCQGFSNMGLRDLKDSRNSLIDHYLRLVLELRPKAFVMENVPGMLAGQTRKILDTAVRLAEENGYKVTQPVRILDAADFGVPQQRRRLFLLAVREDIGTQIQYPSGRAAGQPERPTVLEAIADLPVIERYERLFRENDVGYTKSPESDYAKVARGLVVDPSDLSRPREWNLEICTGCLRTRHSPKSVELYNATPAGETVPGHKLPRLDPKGIAPTLRAGSDSTHGSYTAPRPIHPKYPRCITSREAARLHGFPDWFAFYPLKWHAYRQIGNAVCPPVARAIAYAIRSALGGATASKQPRAIRLGNTFVLPDDRPRTLKRIPHLEHFPPVVEYLFDKAYDKRRRKFRKASFGFVEVTEAIAATGANLPWIREDTFLGEIARSRRVNEILAPTLKHGFSILACTDRGAIGRFVPVGTSGTLEDKETLQIRIDEIHEADTLSLRSVDLNGSGAGVLRLLNQPAVQRKLWDAKNCELNLQSLPKAGLPRNANVYSVTLRRSRRSAPESTLILTCKAAALPNKSRIARIAKQQKAENVTVLVAATSKHLIAVQFDNCSTNPREIARGAFEMK